MKIIICFRFRDFFLFFLFVTENIEHEKLEQWTEWTFKIVWVQFKWQNESFPTGILFITHKRIENMKYFFFCNLLCHQNEIIFYQFAAHIMNMFSSFSVFCRIHLELQASIPAFIKTHFFPLFLFIDNCIYHNYKQHKRKYGVYSGVPKQRRQCIDPLAAFCEHEHCKRNTWIEQPMWTQVERLLAPIL